MFCNSCGKEVKDGKHFCTNCGTKAVTTEVIKCEHCGRPLEEGAKFCQGCGQAVQTDVKTYCAYCGEKLEEGDRFCGKCGHARGNNVVSSFVQKMGQNSGSTAAHDSPVLLDRIKSPLGIKHLILTGLLLLGLIFLFIPTMKVEAEVLDFFGYDFDGSISMANPCPKDLEALEEWLGSSDAEMIVEATKLVGTIYMVVPGLILFGLSMTFVLLPLFQNTLAKKRKFILQFITAGGFIIWILIWRAIYSMLWESSVSINFGFVVHILLLLACIVMTAWIIIDKQKLTVGDGA